MSTQSVDRRSFLKALGAGVLVLAVDGPAIAQESGRSGRGGHELPKQISAWLHIGEDGSITAFTGKVEVGQNIRTSLAQQVAEELHVPFESVTMVMGDTDLVPWDMGTFGSRTTPTMAPVLRNMAASARELLMDKAAAHWEVTRIRMKAEKGRIFDEQTGRSISYGDLVRGEQLTKEVSADPSTTPPGNWRVVGKPIPKAQGRDFVTGRHKYPSDIAREGMLHGAVLRPDAYNAKLVSMDTSGAEKVSGAKLVRDGDFAGVVAPDPLTASYGVGAIDAKWDTPQQPSNAEIFDYLKGHPDDEPSRPQHQTGDVAKAMSTADVKLEERYTVQYIAHAPLEPRAAVAEWNGDKLTVWTGTQRPFGVREELAHAFSIPETQVRVIHPDMGSGYGGKHTGEAAIEAARLAKVAGKPVKVVWTRQEEFTWAYFRPAGVIEIRAAAAKDGKLIAWEHHNYNSGPAAIGTPYDVPNQLIQYHPAKSPLRQGSYRSLAATANNFARESHIDAVAHAAGVEPLEFRLKNLSDDRLKAVLHAAADKFGWGKEKSSEERGYGIACGTDKGGYVAACAEVEIEPLHKHIRVRRVVQAWESGAMVNPDGLRNQNMGAIVQGLGGALFERILFSNGKIENPHFAQYRVPRFMDAPEVEIVLVDRKDLPSAGAGESGLICVAPAIGNALFAATGKRVRNMPMAPTSAIPGVETSPFRS
jgi:isoquinoline 1-oxidoreductase